MLESVPGCRLYGAVAETGGELTLFRAYGATPEEFRAAEAMAAPLPTMASLRDVAENWVARGILNSARLARADVNSWIAHYLDPALIHIFVRLPVDAEDARQGEDGNLCWMVAMKIGRHRTEEGNAFP